MFIIKLFKERALPLFPKQTDHCSATHHPIRSRSSTVSCNLQEILQLTKSRPAAMCIEPVLETGRRTSLKFIISDWRWSRPLLALYKLPRAFQRTQLQASLVFSRSPCFCRAMKTRRSRKNWMSSCFLWGSRPVKAVVDMIWLFLHLRLINSLSFKYRMYLEPQLPQKTCEVFKNI